MSMVALVFFDWFDAGHRLLSLVEKDVMDTSLVVGRGLVIVGSGVSFVAGLELVAFDLGGLNDGLVGGVHGAHELEDSTGGDKSADSSDLLN